jgi:hypothetical protein
VYTKIVYFVPFTYPLASGGQPWLGVTFRYWW